MHVLITFDVASLFIALPTILTIHVWTANISSVGKVFPSDLKVEGSSQSGLKIGNHN